MISVESLVAALHGRRSGRGWIARCPAHQDRTPSLRITERDGKLLVHCFAGCPQGAVIDALKGCGLWPERARQLTPAQRADWARRQRQLGREMSSARLWQRAAIVLAEEVLDQFKTALFDPAATARPPIGEIGWWTRQLARWRGIDRGELVSEYLHWVKHHRRLTAGMVGAARMLEAAEMSWLRAHLGLTAVVGGRRHDA